MTLPVVGEIGAGQASLRALGPGGAAKIMTGAPMPGGRRRGGALRVDRPRRGRRPHRRRRPQLHQHIRPAGDDVAEGDLLVETGRRSSGRAGSGSWPSVGRPTRAGPPAPAGGDPLDRFRAARARRRRWATTRSSTATRSCSPPRSAARARSPTGSASSPTSRPAFLEALHDQLVRADVVITSGGVSQGDFDVVKAALTPEGVWFGPVAMQPGKPQGYGRVGEDRVPIFTLPGNPVSSYISFHVFVLPALRKLMGKAPYAVPTTTARLTKALSSPAGRRQYRRGEIGVDERGPYVAPVGGAGSHLVGDLASANCLIVVPEDTTSVEAGEPVEVLMLEESR